jgi:hypothetical protein
MCNGTKCSRTPLIRINWDGEPSGYAENPDNQIFFNRLHRQAEIEKKNLQTAVLGYIFIYVPIKEKYVIPYTCLEILGKI